MDKGHFEQKIEYARASLFLPFYLVGMVARVQGSIPSDSLQAALNKLSVLYPPLGCRVRVDPDGSAWLTSEGVGELCAEVRQWTSPNDWAQLFLEQEKLPVALDRGPIARFFLLQGDQYSDLVAVVPHVICDGYSMTHVMVDAIALLNDPLREVAQPALPPVVSWRTVRHSVFDNLLLRGIARLINLTCQGQRAVLDQESYQLLNDRYWAHKQNGLLVFTLPPVETSALVVRCRKQGVSVTSALAAAFIKSQEDISPSSPAARRSICVPVNIRNRMPEPPERAVGVYASSVNVHAHYQAGASFWEAARAWHTSIRKVTGSRPALLTPLVLDEVDPLITDGLVSAFATDEWPWALNLMNTFLKVRGEARCLVVSNIGRIDLPEVGSPYRLETLLPFPPLGPGTRMMLNALTVGGQMNLVLKYRMNDLDGKAGQLRDRALSYLFET